MENINKKVSEELTQEETHEQMIIIQFIELKFPFLEYVGNTRQEAADFIKSFEKKGLISAKQRKSIVPFH